MRKTAEITGFNVYCCKKKRVLRAFTLIEMMVVVAIIAILFAILLPVLARAREAAKAFLCTNNMKQIGIGTYNYASDNDGDISNPFWSAPNKPNAHRDSLAHWYMIYNPYLTKEASKNPAAVYTLSFCKTLDCPSTTLSVNHGGCNAPFWNSYTTKTFDYAAAVNGTFHRRLDRNDSKRWMLTEKRDVNSWYTETNAYAEGPLFSYPVTEDDGSTTIYTHVERFQASVAPNRSDYAIGWHHNRAVSFLWPDGRAGLRKVIPYTYAVKDLME